VDDAGAASAHHALDLVSLAIDELPGVVLASAQWATPSASDVPRRSR
jgi:hypothetical protein